MYEVTVTGDFAASHMLKGYEGDCKNLHGHTWKVEVVIAGDRLNEIGLLIDFKEAKKNLRDFLKQLDHVHLNDLPAFKEANPTTENLARFIFDGFAKACVPLKLKRVRVWESDTSSVTYYP